MGLGKKLQRLMNEMGIKQADLCRAADITPSTLNSIIVRDNSKMDIDSFLRICRVLNCKPEYFANDVLEKPVEKTLKDYEEDPETMEFMTMFQNLSSEDKAIVLAVMKAFLK